MAQQSFTIVRLSTKGQLIIPAKIRRKMKLAQQDYLILEDHGDKLVLTGLTPESLKEMRTPRAARSKE